MIATLIFVTSIIVLSSCARETAEGQTIPEEVANTTINKVEPSQDSSQNTEEVPLITIDELYQLAESDTNTVIIDVRSEDNYQLSHIKGAISVPESVIKTGDWVPPDGKLLVLY